MTSLPMPESFFGLGRREYRIVMHVFMDDSTSFRRPGFQCFAGFMSDEHHFNALAVEWKQALDKHGLTHLHTSDFLSGRGDHQGETRSYDERKAVLADFIAIIRRTMQCMIIVAVEKNDFYAYTSKERGGLDTAGFCLQRIANICHKRLSAFPNPSPLNFVFDDSDKDSPRIYAAWAKLKRLHRIQRGLCNSITFAEDHMLYPLQAADLLACAIVQENQKPEADRWAAGSAFAPMFAEAPNWPPGMTVDNEDWNAATFRQYGVFQSN